MKDESEIRSARAEMEAAKAASEKKFSPEPRLPRRYRLYDKIKDNVSLRTIDAVIIITSLLIIIALIVGIVTANPTQ